MAFTSTQKEDIKKKAQQLADASGTGKGSQFFLVDAINELFTPEEIKAQFPAVVNPPEPSPTPMEMEDRTLDIREQDLKLKEKEVQYTTGRIAELTANGVPEEEARKIAEKDLEAMRRPLPFAYGTPEERQEGGFAPFLPDKQTQEVFPSDKVGVDWKQLQKDFGAELGISDEEASAEIESIKNNLFLPEYRKARAEGLSELEAQKQALTNSFAVISDIPKRIEDKASYLQPETFGSEDPVIRAFQPQIEKGEGVPNLSEEQRAYLLDKQNRDVQNKVAKLKQDPTKNTKVIYSKMVNGEERILEAGEYDPRRDKGYKQKKVAKTDAELRTEVLRETPIPWWLDSDKVKKVQEDPEKFATGGFFTTTTPYGTKVETTGAWLLRNATFFSNLGAGIGGKVYDLGPLAEAREEERTAAGFPESPILFNIAKNRGYFGEAQSAADLAKVKTMGEYVGPALYYTTLAGGFAADLLDPSLDLLKGGATALRTGYKTNKALSKLYKANPIGLSEQARSALKVGWNDFVESSFLPNSAAFKNGDPRALISNSIFAEMDAANIARKNADKSVEEVSKILSERNLENTSIAKSIAAERLDRPVGELLEDLTGLFKDPELLKVRSQLEVLEQVAKNPVGASLKGLSRTDLANAIGVAARFDDEIGTAIKSFKTGNAEDRLKNMVGFIYNNHPEAYNAIEKVLMKSSADKATLLASKGIDNLSPDKVVALTRNTFASPEYSQKIMDSVAKSDLGKLAKKLEDVKLIGDVETGFPGGTIGSPQRSLLTPSVKRAVPAFVLNEDQKNVLLNIVREQAQAGKISQADYEAVQRQISGGAISTKRFRNLIDNEVDLTAEALAASQGIGITRASDIKGLPIKDAVSYLEPLESKSFVSNFAKNVKEKFLGAAEKVGNLTLGQRQLLNEAANKITNLNKVLVSELKRIKTDSQLRKIYGVPEGQELSRQQELAYLIVGPQGEAKAAEKITDPATSQKLTDVRIKISELEDEVSRIRYKAESELIRQEEQVLQKVSQQETKIAQVEQAIEDSALKGQERIDRISERYGLVEEATAKKLQSHDDKLIKLDEMRKTNARKRDTAIALAKGDKTKLAKIEADYKKFLAQAEATENKLFQARNKILQDAGVKQEVIEQAVRDATIQHQLGIQRKEERIASLAGRAEEIEANGLLRASRKTEEAIEKIEGLFKEIDDLEKQKDKLTGISFTRNEKRMNDVLLGMIDDLFYARRTTENPFDNITGTNVTRDTSVITKEGLDYLREDINLAIKNSIKDPSTFWAEAGNLMEKVDAMFQNRKVLEQELGTKLFRSPDEVINIYGKSGKIPAEVQISAYYRAEANRIASEVLTDLVANQGITLEGKIGFNEMPRINREMNKIKMGQPPDEDMPFDFRTPVLSQPTFQTDFISYRLRKMVENKAIEEGIVETAEDLVNFFKIDANTAFDLVDDPAFLNAYRTLTEAADEVAEEILIANKLEKAPVSLDEVESIMASVRDPKGDYSKVIEALFGKDIAGEIRGKLVEQISESRDTLIELLDKKYSGREKQLPNKTAELLVNAYNAFTNFRYFAMLNLRPRFHGANLLTGADIVYKTTGKIVSPRDLLEAGAVLANQTPYKVAFTAPSGKPYTYGELNQLVTTALGGSVNKPSFPREAEEEIVQLLRPGFTAEFDNATFMKFINFLKEMPVLEDQLFRYAAMKQALMEGRSIDEAIRIGQISMFDPKNLTKFDKEIQKIALFWSFQRNNLMNSLKNLTTFSGLKKTAKAVAFERDLSKMLTDEETSEFRPEYARDRILLAKLSPKGSKEEQMLISSPSSPSLSAILTIADLIQLNIQNVLGSSVRPEYKLAFGVKDKFDRELKEVPAEHVKIFNTFPLGKPEDAVNFLFKVMGVSPATSYVNDKGDVVIPLNTTEQRNAYKKFIETFALAGISTTITDYIRTFGDNPKLKGLDGLEVLYGAGAITPMAYTNPEVQALYDRYSRNKALKDAIDKLEKEEIKRTTAAPTPEQQKSLKEAQADKLERQQEIVEEGESDLGEFSANALEKMIGRIEYKIEMGEMTEEEGERQIDLIEREMDRRGL